MILNNLPWYSKDLETFEGDILTFGQIPVICLDSKIPSLSNVSEQTVGLWTLFSRSSTYWRVKVSVTKKSY